MFVIRYGENSNVKLLTMDKGVYRKDEWSQDDNELFYRFHDIFFFKITIVFVLLERQKHPINKNP